MKQTLQNILNVKTRVSKFTFIYTKMKQYRYYLFLTTHNILSE